MIILKNLTEAEHTFFSRINTLLKYRIAIGRVQTLAEAADYVLNKYFERLPEYGEYSGQTGFFVNFGENFLFCFN